MKNKCNFKSIQLRKILDLNLYPKHINKYCILTLNLNETLAKDVKHLFQVRKEEGKSERKEKIRKKNGKRKN